MRLIDADKLIKTIEEHDYPLADECGSIDRGDVHDWDNASN